MIVSGSASQSLASDLAEELSRPLTPVSFSRFPDGEILVTAPTTGDSAIIVASTPTAESHIELLQLQDALSEAGIDEITTILPYMGYARQDAAFTAGEPISARAMAKALSTTTDSIILINPHTRAVRDFFAVPTTIIDAAPLLADPLPPNLSSPVFLAPDEGAIDLANSVRDKYGSGETDYFQKTRLSGDEVEISPSDTDVDNRDIVVVDDIIATGGTMSESIAVLTDRGANRVFAVCVHPVLAGSARIKLARAGVTAIYATDTLERRESMVSVASLLAQHLRSSS